MSIEINAKLDVEQFREQHEELRILLSRSEPNIMACLERIKKSQSKQREDKKDARAKVKKERSQKWNKSVIDAKSNHENSLKAQK